MAEIQVTETTLHDLHAPVGLFEFFQRADIHLPMPYDQLIRRCRAFTEAGPWIDWLEHHKQVFFPGVELWTIGELRKIYETSVRQPQNYEIPEVVLRRMLQSLNTIEYCVKQIAEGEMRRLQPSPEHCQGGTDAEQ
jgi:hypothetical protein